MPTIIVSDEQKPYIETMQRFLDLMGTEKIRSIACVALVEPKEDEDESTFDITSYWNITAYEKMTAADVLNTDAMWSVMKARLEDEGFDFADQE